MTTREDRRTPRLGGWGFEGESFDPPEPMLDGLRRELGKTEPFPWPDAEAMVAVVPKPIEVGDLGSADVSTDPLDRLRHARGQGTPDLMRLRSGTIRHLPDAVVRPSDDDELETVLRSASDRGFRVVPWGGGTSVTGGVNLVPDDRPALVVDLERFSGLLDLDEVSG
ncbi:MAG: FAD-binding protein, partial [Acidobacteriota bacterium]